MTTFLINANIGNVKREDRQKWRRQQHSKKYDDSNEIFNNISVQCFDHALICSPQGTSKILTITSHSFINKFISSPLISIIFDRIVPFFDVILLISSLFAYILNKINDLMTKKIKFKKRIISRQQTQIMSMYSLFFL